MVYATAGGESVLRSLTAANAIQNLPVAPRPPLPTAPIPRVPIPPIGGGAAAAGGGVAGGAATASSGATIASAIGAGVLAFGAGFAVGDAIAGSLGIEYPGGKNALQYFFGGKNPGIGATGAVSGPLATSYEGDPLFTGGQSAGVAYGVSYETQIYQRENPSNAGPWTPRSGLNNQPSPMLGPISGGSQSGGTVTYYTADGQPMFINFGGSNGYDPNGFFVYRYRNVAFTRLDGQPDTGGNPRGAPQPGTLNRRVGAPLTAAPTAPSPAPTPTTAPPTPSAPTPPGEPVNPPKERDPLLPPWLDPLTAVGIAVGAAAGLAGPPAPGLAGPPAPGPNTTPINNPTPGAGEGGTTPPSKTRTDNQCRCNIPLMNKLNDLEKNLDRSLGGAAGLAADGGIFAYLQRMQAFAEKAWKATQMQKVLDVLTFIGVMHNVSMLSREVGETFFYLVSQGLDIVGIDDEEGNALDIGQIVGKSVNSYLESVFGEAFVDGAKDSYRKANRIVQSASMVIWSIRSIQDSSLDLMEWIGENTGKIGNALKRFGVVGDRAYPWMSEQAQARDRNRARFSKVTDTLENAEDRLSSYTVATSAVLETTQEVNELGQNWGSFKESLNDAPNPWFDNEPVQEKVATETAASQSPNITAADTQKTE